MCNGITNLRLPQNPGTKRTVNSDNDGNSIINTHTHTRQPMHTAMYFGFCSLN